MSEKDYIKKHANNSRLFKKIFQTVLSTIIKLKMYVSLEFKLQLNSSDRKKLFQLMRKQSSAIYIDSAIYKAKQYPTDKKVILGGKALFEKLCRNHLTCETREKLKRERKEKRQGTLINIGSKAVKGNKVWQVLKVAILFPVLGEVLPRDLSPLKSLLVEGAWDRVRRRLVPLEVGGTAQCGIFRTAFANNPNS